MKKFLPGVDDEGFSYLKLMAESHNATIFLEGTFSAKITHFEGSFICPENEETIGSWMEFRAGDGLFDIFDEFIGTLKVDRHVWFLRLFERPEENLDVVGRKQVFFILGVGNRVDGGLVLSRERFSEYFRVKYWQLAVKTDPIFCIFGMDNSFPADLTSFFSIFSWIFQILMSLELVVSILRYFPWFFIQQISVRASSTS